jgi:hypothetical protein
MLDTAVLSQAQREQYQQSGWVAVPGLVDSASLEQLRRVTDEFVDASRELTGSNILYDLDVGHTADEPRLRRLSSPTDLHATYWEFASQSVITDVAVDLLGPDVKFHHSKLNFKAPRGGEEVKWHQDIQFWPHTNYDLLTIGVFLEDVEGGWARSGSSRAARTGRSSISTTRTSGGSVRSATATSSEPEWMQPSTRSDPPAPSPCTTAAPCTGRRPTGRTGRGRFSSRRMPPPTRSPTPTSSSSHPTAKS